MTTVVVVWLNVRSRVRESKGKKAHIHELQVNFLLFGRLMACMRVVPFQYERINKC